MISADGDVRPCPICKEPIDVADWPVCEAEACQNCGAALYIDFGDELLATPWAKVEF